MRARLAAVALAVSVTAGCGGGGAASSGGGGGGGGGGAAGEVRRTFVLPHVLETSGRISNMAVGDLDQDGSPDLITFDPSSSSLEVLLSTRLRESPTRPSLGQTRLVQGDGAFEGIDHIFVWESTADVATGDVDGDGRLDIVVAGGAEARLGIWGTGPSDVWAVGAPLLLDTGVACNRVALGDLDGDGDMDLACLDEALGQLTLFHQTSSSPLSFTVDTSPPVIGACRGLVCLDLNRDGRLECVTNGYGRDVLVIFDQNAAGVLSPRDVATGQATGRAMGVGDVDGDGWCDVVLCTEDGSKLVCLHQRSASPGFFDVFVSDLSIAINEEGIEACQISIDEPGVHLHVRESPSRPSGGVMVRESPTKASLGRTSVRVSMTQPGLAVADFDRDGHLDVLASPITGDPDFDLLMIYGTPDSPGGFGPTERATSGDHSGIATGKRQHACIADLDGDGHSDIATGDPDFDLLRLVYTDDVPAPASPTFDVRIRESPTRQSTGLTSIDLDRDGRLDLVTCTTTGLDIRYGAPGNRFLAPVTLGVAQSFVSVCVGDVNGDGCPDLLAATAQTALCVLRDPADPRGFLPPIPFPPSPGGNFRALTIADVDLDGHPDCVAIRESPSKASLGRGQGNGFFDVFTELDVGVSSPMGVAVGDLNGDGRPDLAVCGDGPDGSSVVLRDPLSPTTWATPQRLSLQGGVRVATGDVNGDGRLDVVTTGSPGCIVSLQSPQRRGEFLVCYSLSSLECGGLSLCDLNRDGLLDVCFVESALGRLVCSTGDPDFDLLRVLSLNGLPPGVPFGGIFVSSGDLDGDGRCDLVTACPTQLGAVQGTIIVFGGRL